jgi:hypothetical protein
VGGRNAVAAEFVARHWRTVLFANEPEDLSKLRSPRTASTEALVVQLI